MERVAFQNTVAAAVAKKRGISHAAAAALVAGSRVGVLKVADLKYLIYKGPDYWAEKIIEQQLGENKPAAGRA